MGNSSLLLRARLRFSNLDRDYKGAAIDTKLELSLCDYDHRKRRLTLDEQMHLYSIAGLLLHSAPTPKPTCSRQLQAIGIAREIAHSRTLMDFTGA
jgi:hypothetical protein